jgi:GNAT superfamily N-acetyltransferase
LAPSSKTETAPPAFTLPAALTSQGFSLRAETEEDIPFLMALFASTREEELAQAPWPPEQKAGFLSMQFNAQRTHYRTHTPDADWIVLLHEGAPIGRIYLHWVKSSVDLMDITLVPGYRGHGVGTSLLTQLLAQADGLGRDIYLFVERFNPAHRLYVRLGFVEIADGDVYLEMKRTPGAPLASSVS